MSSFSTVLILTFMLILVALLCLGVGYIFAKKKLANKCGYSPDKTKGNDCGRSTKCDLCQFDDDHKKK